MPRFVGRNPKHSPSSDSHHLASNLSPLPLKEDETSPKASIYHRQCQFMSKLILILSSPSCVVSCCHLIHLGKKDLSYKWDEKSIWARWRAFTRLNNHSHDCWIASRLRNIKNKPNNNYNCFQKSKQLKLSSTKNLNLFLHSSSTNSSALISITFQSNLTLDENLQGI